MNDPFFSFVIPTKNRSKYLKYALKSCLNQHFDNYEIIISDNNSTDETRKISLSWDDKRIKYFNTGRDLSVTDNFEHGLLKAQGNYILFLADDEAYMPYALRELKNIIDNTNAEIVSFSRKATYVFEGASVGVPNSIKIAPFTNKKVFIDAEYELKRLLSLKNIRYLREDFGYINRALPLAVKTVVSKNLIDSVISEVGFYHHLAPDWSACVFSLSKIKKLILYDRHLNMSGVVAESNGPLYASERIFDGETANQILKIEHVPLKCPTFTNIICNAILAGKNILSPKYDHLSIDLNYYTHQLLRDLLVWKTNDIEIETMLNEVKLFLGKSSITEHSGFLYNFDKRRLRKFGYYFYILKKKYKNLIESREKGRSIWDHIYTGEKNGFTNILEAQEKFISIEKNLLNNPFAIKLFNKHFPNAIPI